MSNLPDSARFCCGRLIALRQISRNTYAGYEYERDKVTVSARRHVCDPGSATSGDPRVTGRR